MYDIIVVGGGPAGLTAALYGLRNGKKVIVIEKSVFGGQIVNSPKVENIPGFESISGDEFADKYLDQVMAQGGEVLMEEVLSVRKENDHFAALLDSGKEVEGLSVILATGTKHRTLGLPMEEDFIGNGISFCAVCDGDYYAGKKVVMIGGGNSAFVESNLLAGIVGELVLLQDLPEFTADEKLREQLFKNSNVRGVTGTKVLSYIEKDGALAGVRYEKDGQVFDEYCDGVFLAVGLVPCGKAFKDLASLDERGYFSAGEDCKSVTPGVFVAGDCRTKSLRQVTTACADGAIAAIAACDYIRDL